MTESNQKLRDKLQSIERIITTALASQPHSDEECGEHLRKALSDIIKEIGVELFGNSAAMREALKEIVDICDGTAKGAKDSSQSEDRLIIYNLAKVALSKPARNCDRFHTWKEAWETFYDERCAVSHKPYDGGISAAFLEWLFALVSENRGEP